ADPRRATIYERYAGTNLELIASRRIRIARVGDRDRGRKGSRERRGSSRRELVRRAEDFRPIIRQVPRGRSDLEPLATVSRIQSRNRVLGVVERRPEVHGQR